MKTGFVNGLAVMDVDGAALNNLGKDVTNTYDNAVAVKKYRKNM